MGESGIARIFKHGPSQAVRLPLAFHRPGDRGGSGASGLTPADRWCDRNPGSCSPPTPGPGPSATTTIKAPARSHDPGKEVPRVGQALGPTSRACQAESLTDFLAAVIPSTAGYSKKPGPEKFLQNCFTQGL